MPYSIKKVAKKSCYKVVNTRNKRVFAKCTTRKRAEKQVRLLRAIENNKNFVLRRQTRKRSPR